MNRILLGVLVCLIGGSSVPAQGIDAREVLGRTPILYVCRAPDRDGTHAYMRLRSFARPGAALKVLDPATGRTRVLVSAPEGMIRRPCVHFDGRRVVFAMCRGPQETFHIYEIEVDPATLFADEASKAKCKPRQLTFAPDVYDVDPIYLPDGKIAFCSTRDLKIVPCAGQLVPQMFRMDADGANIHQITRSTVHENELSLTPDGRILYSRWDYVDRNFGDGHGFWVANPDGGNPSVVWGNNTSHPAAPWTARMIPGTGKLLCILGTHHGSLGGALAIVNPELAVDGRRSIERTWPEDVIKRFDNPPKMVLPVDGKAQGMTKMTCMWPDPAKQLLPLSHDYRLHGWNDDLNTVKPWYNCPFPLDERHFLFVVAKDRRSPAAIGLGDVDGEQVRLHEEQPGCFHPMPLAPSRRPAPLPSDRDFEANDGVFFIRNVYAGTHMERVAPGTIRSVRVVQAHSKRGKAGHIWRALGHQEGAIGWSNFVAKTVLGAAPVEADGSAAFRVPPDRFVYFQLLDANGMMVHSMRSGTTIHSGQRRGCLGCHEDRTRAAVSAPTMGPAVAMAFRREPSRLTRRGEPRRFNYLTEVQPVLDRHCVRCHDFGGPGSKKIVLAGDKNFGFNTSYCELQSKGLTGAIGAGPAGHLPALSWGSHTSKLIAMLRAGHNDVRLSDAEMATLITWVDLNGPYYPTGYSARPGPAPGRNPLTSQQTRRFLEITGLRNNQLAHAYEYTGPQVSFDRPELSPVLDRIENRADRVEALMILKAAKWSLEQRPRADMPGFTRYHPADEKRRAHYEKYRRIEREVRQAIRTGAKVFDSDQADPETMGL